MSGESGRKRLHLLDEIRGFAVLCMVFYHAFFTLYDVFDSKPAERLFDFFTPAEPFFAGAFILICGVSSRLSRSNLRRGLILLGVALLVTLATWGLGFFGIDVLIRFGILHMLAVSLLIFAAARPLLDKIPAPAALAALALLYLVTCRIGDGLAGLPGLYWHIPDAAAGTGFLFIIGIYDASFASADYFPLLPWIFIFLIGTVLGKYVRRPLPEKILSKRCLPPLSFLGRHALLIYVAHQPVIFLLALGLDGLI